MKKTQLLGVLVIERLAVASCGMAEPHPVGPGEAGIGDPPRHGLLSIPLLECSFGTKRNGEVIIRDGVNVGTWCDLGFVLGVFNPGCLCGFITSEGGT